MRATCKRRTVERQEPAKLRPERAFIRPEQTERRTGAAALRRPKRLSTLKQLDRLAPAPQTDSASSPPVRFSARLRDVLILEGRCATLGTTFSSSRCKSGR